MNQAARESYLRKRKLFQTISPPVCKIHDDSNTKPVKKQWLSVKNRWKNLHHRRENGIFQAVGQN
jgi:hypothetical protein